MYIRRCCCPRSSQPKSAQRRASSPAKQGQCPPHGFVSQLDSTSLDCSAMHRLINCLLTLSLVLSLGCMCLWIRSHFDYDMVHYEARSGFQTNVCSVRGRVTLLHSNLYWEKPRGPGTQYSRFSAGEKKGLDLANDFDSSNGRHFWNRLGFTLRSLHGPINTTIHIFFVSAPYWSLVGLFAALPALQFLRLHRRRRLMHQRRRAGRCIACGYDLSATRDCCPECGRSQTKNSAPERVY